MNCCGKRNVESDHPRVANVLSFGRRVCHRFCDIGMPKPLKRRIIATAGNAQAMRRLGRLFGPATGKLCVIVSPAEEPTMSDSEPNADEGANPADDMDTFEGAD